MNPIYFIAKQCGVCDGVGFKCKPYKPQWNPRQESIDEKINKQHKLEYAFRRYLIRVWESYCSRNGLSIEKFELKFLCRFLAVRTNWYSYIRRFPSQPKIPDNPKTVAFFAVTLASFIAAEKNGWTPEIERQFEKSNPWMKNEFSKNQKKFT